MTTYTVVDVINDLVAEVHLECKVIETDDCKEACRIYNEAPKPANLYSRTLYAHNQGLTNAQYKYYAEST